MRARRHILVIMAIWGILAGALPGSASAQEAEELISKILEEIYEGETEDNMVSDIRDELLLLHENPVNINADDLGELRRLHLLNDIQARNLAAYRKKYGPFMTLYELLAVDAFGRTSIEKIMPFVYAGPEGTPAAGTGNKKSRHELILRTQRQLHLPRGYKIPADSLQIGNPSSFYLGDPYRYYFRYHVKTGAHVQMNITAEKDPGEMFLGIPQKVNGQITAGLSRPVGFDRYSAHIAIRDLGLLRTLVLGDFHVQCGQGLVMWSGMSFAGSSDPSSFKRYAPVVRANSSADESRSLRGAAGTLQWKSIALSLFFSRKKADARLVSGEDGSVVVSSIQESGYHRTISEIMNKHALGMTHFGGHFSFANDRLRTGFTAYKTILDIGLAGKSGFSGMHAFSGKDNLNAGLNLEYIMRKTLLFGELGYSIDGGFAALTGVTHNATNGSIVSIMLREYRKEYQNLMSEAPGRRSGNANERGLKLALEAPLSRVVALHMFTEHYSYPGIVSNNNNIVRGQKHEASLAWKLSNSADLALRYRFERAVDNENSQEHWFDKMMFVQKQGFRVKAGFTISEAFCVKGLFEFTRVRGIDFGKSEQGSLMAMDVFYRPLHDKFRLSFRYALFNTDGYASRLYAYESDVLYASSMPSYYGSGFRTYLLLQYSPFRWMNIWLRLSLTNYTDRNVIGSGLDEISGNKKSEIKLQGRLKF